VEPGGRFTGDPEALHNLMFEEPGSGTLLYVDEVLPHLWQGPWEDAS
jgi:hypothetical protein